MSSDRNKRKKAVVLDPVRIKWLEALTEEYSERGGVNMGGYIDMELTPGVVASYYPEMNGAVIYFRRASLNRHDKLMVFKVELWDTKDMKQVVLPMMMRRILSGEMFNLYDMYGMEVLIPDVTLPNTTVFSPWRILACLPGGRKKIYGNGIGTLELTSVVALCDGTECLITWQGDSAPARPGTLLGHGLFKYFRSPPIPLQMFREGRVPKLYFYRALETDECLIHRQMPRKLPVVAGQKMPVETMTLTSLREVYGWEMIDFRPEETREEKKKKEEQREQEDDDDDSDYRAEEPEEGGNEAGSEQTERRQYRICMKGGRPVAMG
jgi:hypothetical protein